MTPDMLSAPVVDDASLIVRLLDDDRDMVAIVHAIRDRHVLDRTAQLMESFVRFDGLMEAAAIEIRHIRNLLGGN